MKTYLFVSHYAIGIPTGMKYKIASDVDTQSIIITHNKIEYDIVYNKKADWVRLLINDRRTGAWKDLPFNIGTYRFLPDGVKVGEGNEYEEH